MAIALGVVALGLAAHGVGGRPDLLDAAEVALLDRERLQRPEVLAQLVDERLAGGDVELDDVVVGDAVEVLHHRPEAVAVGADEHGAARPGGRGPAPRPSRACRRSTTSFRHSASGSCPGGTWA